MADPRQCPPHVSASFTLPPKVDSVFAQRELREHLPGTRVIYDPTQRTYAVFQHEWRPPHLGHTLDMYVHRVVNDILATAQVFERVDIIYSQATRLEAA
jgi:hypothetical protein